MYKDKRIPFYHRINFQLIFLLMTFLLFLNKPVTIINSFDAREVIPQIYPNLPDPQVQFGHGRSKVDVGMHIDNFSTFDVKDGHFIFEGDVWFQFNPSNVSLDTIAKFSFDNGFIVSKSEPFTKIINGLMFASYHVRAEFYSELDHRLFPFNDHRIFIILKNDFFTPQDIMFETDFRNLTLQKNIKPMGWRPLLFAGKTGYFKTNLKAGDGQKVINYPVTIFSLDVLKPGFRKIFAIVTPCLVLFLFGLLALLIQGNHNLQITVAVGSLSGLIIYRFVIESLIPNVGYFTPADYLFLICLASTSLVMLFVIRDLNSGIAMRTKSKLFYWIQIIALGLFYYLTEVIA